MSARCRVLASLLVFFALLSSAGIVAAAQIWTDGNADGLPDASPISQPPNTNVVVGLWIDAESFGWTNYLAYVEWTSGCLQYEGATYVISGGSNFPIDDFSHPSGLGFSGSGYNESGVDHIGDINFTVLTPIACCVTPITNPKNPYYVFSQLGAGTAYTLFATSTPTCYGEGAPAGACCLLDGTCIFVLETDCNAAGGTYQGAGVQCASAKCPPASAACCLLDGSCIDGVEPNDCVAKGGTPQKLGSVCAETVCPQLTEACCFPRGDCLDLLSDACDAAGGVSQGKATSCATATCPSLPEACCLLDGTCQDLAFDVCTAAGGAPKGVGTSCASTICPPPLGACCFPEGNCLQLPEESCNGLWQGPLTRCDISCWVEACCDPVGFCFDVFPGYCELVGGVPQGPGTTCAIVDCFFETEACCLLGECIDETPAICWGMGGSSQGPGTTCATTKCDSASEACCYPDGYCFLKDPIICKGTGGIPQGPGTTCETVTCPQPPTRGACCLLTGRCEFVSPERCASKGGTFRGLGIPCADSILCPQPPFAADEDGAKRASEAERGLLGGPKALSSYPNPTRNNATVVFRIPDDGVTTDLAVYDVSGRRIATLASGRFSTGEWTATWDGRDALTGDSAPPGVYFVQLELPGQSFALKLVLVQ